MALWAIVLKNDDTGLDLDWCDPIEADSPEEAMAIVHAEPWEPYEGEEFPELEAIPEEIRKGTRRGYRIVDPFRVAGGPAAGFRESKHAAGQRRKARPRKPGKRWS